ncbi:sigma 54-interacting transcriptional regulator [Candidatus Nitrospira bockiana]
MRGMIEGPRAQPLPSSLSASRPVLHGRSPVWRRVMERVAYLARSPAPVLIQGEPGSGKSALALHLHHLSDDKDTFIEIDCRSPRLRLPQGVGPSLDAWLAPGGEARTVCLEAMDGLSGRQQLALLGFLERAGDRPAGPARLIATARTSLRMHVLDGRFHDDLLSRFIEVTVPPLRERPDDIHELARWWLIDLAEGGPVPRVSKDAMALLLDYPWPGNVRELHEVLLRAVRASSSEDAMIRGRHVAKALRGA